MEKVKELMIKPIMSDKEADAMMGKFLKAEDCKTLVTYDCDVYDKESGQCLAKFRKGVIPANIQKVAYNSLLIAARKSMNRGTAGGEVDGKVSDNYLRKKDGKRSKTNQASQSVDSGIVGYFDRNPRTPFCRLTAFTQQHLDKFKNSYPIIKFVDKWYSKLMPTYYKKQRSLADRTSQDFVIRDTAFTTVTVNKNYVTAAHKDSGDFKDGFGNLVALRKGKYLGCYLVLVRWGVGFDLQNGDLLMMDVHQVHANTPMIKDNNKVVRLSLVMYYRENMFKCGSKKQEHENAKTRNKGDKLNVKL